jgi:[Skp1-protein]-hydroxyproline N-acetylglucosaminyltransferase
MRSPSSATKKPHHRRPPPSPLAGLNHQVVSGIVILLFLYTFVIFGAVWRIPVPSFGSEQHMFLHDQHQQHPDAIDSVSDVSAKAGQEEDEHRPVEHEGDNQHEIDAVRHQFPVMVQGNDDMEDIIHPGILYALTGGRRSTMNRIMKVPKFWDSSAYGPGGARGYLGNHGERLITPGEAANVGSLYEGKETIYISVASYRDPECGPTVESILARAKYPERIRVAIIAQQSSKEDPNYCAPEKPCDTNPEQAYCKYAKQVDVYNVEAELSVGPVFARHLAHRMYRGEHFAMQVDSHIRFTEDWDEDIIWQWKSAKNEMAVLTTYLSDIIGSIDPVSNKSKHPGRPIMCKSDYEGRGKTKHLRHGQQPEGPPGIKGQPTLHPFWAAGFSFARAHFVIQVPYDQYLPMVFQGEEISMGLRGFTYGYDYYAAERSVCFHMYAIKENKEKRKHVKLFWENGSMYGGAEVQAMKRLNGIIAMGDPNDTYDHTDEDKYGLGKIRTTKKFFDTFGIHTDTQVVEEGLCQFVGKPMMKEIQPHLRKNKMGIDYDEIDYKYISAATRRKQEAIDRNV